MKNLMKLTLTATVAATFTIALNASADGIAASPKVQQFLNERAACRAVAAPQASVTYRTSALEGIAASPKVSQMLAEQKVVLRGAPVTEVVSTAYNPTGADGVTASPKSRSQLNERSTPIVIAPLK